VSPSPSTPTDPSQQGCSRTSVGFTPLTELTSATYQGQRGGLYPDGSNAPPAVHLTAGVGLARAIRPLDSSGQPSATGRYAFVSIGMSNTTQEFSTFKPMADSDSLRSPRLAVVDGAQGGMTASDWSNPSCACWTELDNRLRAAGLTRAQVAAAWIKLADAQPSEGWPAHAQRLQRETETVLQLLAAGFPNLRLAYLSSRIYAGYATSTLNPEPYAYQSGFAMRWVIEDQINGALPYAGASRKAPWVAWGPYLWADGTRTRGDGLSWTCGDFQSDGTHPSTSGRQKVAQQLLDFVRSDPTARLWYLAAP
jgi:lysophospholipase L1-like esterase